MTQEQLAFINHIYNTLRISCTVYDSQSNLVFTNAEESKLMDLFIKKSQKNVCKEKIPYVEKIEGNIYYWIIQYEGELFFWGPIASDLVQMTEIRAFCHQYQINFRNHLIPKFEFEKIFDYLCFFSWGICKEEISIEEIKKEQNGLIDSFEKDKTMYKIEQAENDLVRSPYEVELKWLGALENGEEVDMSEEGKNGYFGIVSNESDYKQREYMTITCIALATRAAIRGGVPPLVAYETSDLILQKISKCKTVVELDEMQLSGRAKFLELVREYKASKYGALVEQCKDYIAKHLYQQFTIQQIAREMSVSRSYLSSIFSKQTGMSMKEYVIEQKLIAASNMLKYSGESLFNIAEYMKFSSQSSFCTFFKKKYGITPLKYREQYQIKEFQERK